jgi:hypothetical protein
MGGGILDFKTGPRRTDSSGLQGRVGGQEWELGQGSAVAGVELWRGGKGDT